MITMQEIDSIERSIEETLRDDANRKVPFVDRTALLLMLRICAAARRGVEADAEILALTDKAMRWDALADDRLDRADKFEAALAIAKERA